MSNFHNTRRYDLTVYFSDSPCPLEIHNACHLGTEGGLLRIVTEDGETQWWPLCNVFNIRKMNRPTP